MIACMDVSRSCTQWDNTKLIKARRIATRRRAKAACLRCKARKSKCSDFRPCTRCSQERRGDCIENGLFRNVQNTPFSLFDAGLSTTDNVVEYLCLSKHPVDHGPQHRTTNSGGGSLSYSVGGQARLDSPRLPITANATLGLSAIPRRTGSKLSTTSPKLQATAKQHHTGNAAVLNTTTEGGEERNEWLWEAAAGPGKEDPFHDDLRRSQLLWGQMQSATSRKQLCGTWFEQP